jgi:hypothetical protein
MVIDVSQCDCFVLLMSFGISPSAIAAGVVQHLDLYVAVVRFLDIISCHSLQ